ncbi:MAG: DinB family protein [Phycisphaerae bacterium]|nr:DinB family protein [Phycisphaerae bacterium]
MAPPQPTTPPEDPNAYRARMIEQLGGRDPITVFSETAHALGQLVSRFPARHFHRRPFPGKWTPCEVLGHLVDVEWTLGYRTRLILCQDRPRIPSMDQEQWASGQRHAEREPTELLAEFRALRGINLRLWRSLTDRDLDRTGNHEERGLESLRDILQMYAAHDLSHIDQLTRYLEAAQED